MKKLLSILAASTTLCALASHDVYLWKGEEFTKYEGIDSISFENPNAKQDSIIAARQDSLKQSSTPIAYMFYNEFVPDGGILKVKGVNFFDSSTKVGFTNNDSTVVWVDESNGLEIKDLDNYSEIWVKVPEGTANNKPVIFANTINGKQSSSKILFRDTRNILTDFETKDDDYTSGTNNNLNYLYEAGIVPKAEDGSYRVETSNAYINYGLSEVPENYHISGNKNQYGIFDGLNDWSSIRWSPNREGINQDLSVFGSFASEASNLNEYCLKFEIYIPDSHSIEGALLSVGFLPGGNSKTSDDLINERRFCGVLQMSHILWNNEYEVWTVNSCSSTSTGGEWMTVTIPFSDLKYNLAEKSYISAARHFILNDWGDVDEIDLTEAAKSFGDGKEGVNEAAHLSYADVNPDATDTGYWGKLIIGYNTYDKAMMDEDFCLLIDNIRVVPYDGNGAIYPRMMWGTPSQHYELNPRENSYEAY